MPHRHNQETPHWHKWNKHHTGISHSHNQLTPGKPYRHNQWTQRKQTPQAWQYKIFHHASKQTKQCNIRLTYLSQLKPAPLGDINCGLYWRVNLYYYCYYEQVSTDSVMGWNTCKLFYTVICIIPGVLVTYQSKWTLHRRLNASSVVSFPQILLSKKAITSSKSSVKSQNLPLSWNQGGYDWSLAYISF